MLKNRERIKEYLFSANKWLMAQWLYRNYGLKSGDIVRLKSGGPNLVIAEGHAVRYDCVLILELREYIANEEGKYTGSWHPWDLPAACVEKTR